MPDDHTSSPAPQPRGAAAGDQTPSRIAERRVRVLLPLPLPSMLDYLLPEDFASPAPGSFVRVPLGQRTLAGIVWDGADDELPAERLKPICEVLPTAALQSELRRFIERVAGYTMAPLGSVLRMAISVPEAFQPPRPRRLCAVAPGGVAALADRELGRPLTPVRRRVLEALRDGPPLPTAELAQLAGCGAGVVRDLMAAGLIEERLAPAEPLKMAAPDWRRP